MRYHHEKPTMYRNMYGETYECDHPVYSKYTLFKMGKKGLSDSHDSTNDVGHEDNAYHTRTMGNLFRSEGCLDSRNLHAPL